MSYDALTQALSAWYWAGALAARVLVGLFFVATGWGKITSPEGLDRMRATMKEAGIPFPNFQGVFVAWAELVAGAFLVLGLATPIASFALFVVMGVAIATTKLGEIDADGPMEWLGQVLYLPEVLLAALLLWLTVSPPGPVSADQLLGL